MARRVKFKYGKNYGATENGTVKTLSLQSAGQLEKEKVGKILKFKEVPDDPKPKAEAPKQDKADPKAAARVTK